MTVGPPVLSRAGHTWSEQEKGVLSRAVLHAHRCGLAEPWNVRVHGHRVEIAENLPPALRGHAGADRNGVIATGCALAVVTSAVRVLGWAPETVLFGDPDRAELVATVVANRRHRPSPADVGRYRAVFEQRRHHRTLDPGDPEALPPAVRDAVVRAGAVADAQVVPVPAVVAAHRKRGMDPGLLVVTATDGRRGQLVAGVALQRAWLSATALGLTAATVIEPFETREFRQRMVRHARVDGSPQLLLVLGRSPSTTEA
ncbi:hypothetical protein B1813_04960 [Saccharomonospora piscinae]|uniref:Nitroreductase family protein n=1 Tax=Saccharomonospora piscinae TaxID=687388 RepID=A0A1V9A9X5_SACPI|nr:hypothetical protein [Saccharomonospora piscinae]OQO93871.1 hypothetical protein B1813_04960 [Saccharomonospora piscinae]TLW95040.1 hypothetical protein FFT09_04100 [Saccharomonospora piscinae]